ncbi:hypothetical protein Vretimale_7786 [Volvox reticuliferus]|uniref:Histone-lysine N-methyltransferase, H3 lysine-79 specific n=1 Tax=Volvox reticuliferus TaxID=1737510 RepID=A0A8J4FG96_9CHLO|nr:hypothetical protein Vretifemale_4952 [Volvox reticuliferus]GIM02975.1 hypothetical protein Vretimale_7786 [Volvox reticuliferus]
MFVKRHIIHGCRGPGVKLSRGLPTGYGIGQQRRRVVSVAAASPTFATETALDINFSHHVKARRGGSIFLSQAECVDLLTRITDSCQSSGPGKPVAAYYANQDVDGEAGLMSQVLDALYDDAEEVFNSKRGYMIPKREAALVDSTGGSATYGETTGDGVMRLLRNVPLQPDDVLVDLGSGLGRLVLQVACSANIRRCVGIELSASRHEQACWVAMQLATLDATNPRVTTSEGEVTLGHKFELRPADALAGLLQTEQQHPRQPLLQTVRLLEEVDAEVEPIGCSDEGDDGGGGRGLLLSPVELRLGNILTADLGDGSVFFLGSTAFSAAACRAITSRLFRHPPFRLLVTSRALPFPSPLTLLGQFPCGFTWMAAGTAYVYIRSLREAPAGLLAAFLTSTATGRAPAPAPSQESYGETCDGEEERGPDDAGGLAWLPSTCTMSLIPGDLMV